MKISIDIDEVLTNFNEEFLNFYNDKYETNFNVEDIKVYDLSKLLKISMQETITRVREYYASEEFKKIKPMFICPIGISDFKSITILLGTHFYKCSKLFDK